MWIFVMSIQCVLMMETSRSPCEDIWMNAKKMIIFLNLRMNIHDESQNDDCAKSDECKKGWLLCDESSHESLCWWLRGVAMNAKKDEWLSDDYCETTLYWILCADFMMNTLGWPMIAVKMLIVWWICVWIFVMKTAMIMMSINDGDCAESSVVQ